MKGSGNMRYYQINNKCIRQTKVKQEEREREEIDKKENEEE